MQRHHYQARKLRLQRLIAKAQARVHELAAHEDTSTVGKRVRTMAARTLARHQKSLAALVELYGATFNDNEG